MLRLIDVHVFVGDIGDFTEEEEANIMNNSVLDMRKYRRCRFWIGAEEILDAEYLQKMGIVWSNATEILIRGICLQVSHNQDKPYVIDFNLTKDDLGELSIEGGKCSCTAGGNGKCKHAVVLLLTLTRWVSFFIIVNYYEIIYLWFIFYSGLQKLTFIHGRLRTTLVTGKNQ